MIHYSFIGYMLASAIIMIVCVIAYRLLLENKVRPSANRLILLSIYAISFIIPLLSAVIPVSKSETGIEIGLPVFTGVTENINEETAGRSLDIHEILFGISFIYYLGLFLTFLISLFSIGHLFSLLRKSKKMEFEDVEIYVHGNKKLSSFSWFNKIFLHKDSLNSDHKDLQMLISHEKAHLDKGHWMDLGLAQIILIFQWFNPAARFMRNELQRIHEYEADETVLKSGIDEKDYQMLLIQNISGNRYSGLTDGLNNCSLKKRIIMMKKTKFKKDWVTRGIAVCCFAILGGFIIHIPAVASVLETSPLSTESNEKLATINSVDIKKPEVDKPLAVTKVNANTKSDKQSTGDPQGNNSVKQKGTLDRYPDAYIEVDKAAEYEGGQSQLLSDLIETINYPEDAKEKKIQGRVVVRFQINTNGTLSNCEVAYSQNPILDEAALKAVENLPGKWQPAEVDGKPVASVFNLPVTFKLK